MNHAFAAIDGAELAGVTGGSKNGVPGIRGTIGDFVMGALDKPQKSLDTARDLLGMPASGRPGDVYTPAQMNDQGGITPGRFDAAPSMDGVSVPMSQ